MVLRHAILNGGRGGILSEKRRRRAAQAPGGTGGRVPHFPRLEPKWLLSLSLCRAWGKRQRPLSFFRQGYGAGVNPQDSVLSLSSSPGHEGLSNPLGLVGPPDVRGALDGV